MTGIVQTVIPGLTVVQESMLNHGTCGGGMGEGVSCDSCRIPGGDRDQV